MTTQKEQVHFDSLGETLAATLFLPRASGPASVVIVCHGAGEFKENYTELCEHLASRGVASLAVDMHGHGASGGRRFHVDMKEWVADIQAAIGFLTLRPEIDEGRIGAFGLSSGGTAILEAGVVEPRLKALIPLDATVRNSLPGWQTAFLKGLVGLGRLKQAVTGSVMRVPLAKLSVGPKMASDPEINKRIMADAHMLEAFMQFPFPGGEQAFFVDTITRVSQIKAPTLILWGEDDELDSPETARLLLAALTCKKDLQIIPGNGHVGHLDRNRAKVFALTADWACEHLGAGCAAGTRSAAPSAPKTCECH